jgi:hypothetical protein
VATRVLSRSASPVYSHAVSVYVDPEEFRGWALESTATNPEVFKVEARTIEDAAREGAVTWAEKYGRCTYEIIRISCRIIPSSGIMTPETCAAEGRVFSIADLFFDRTVGRPGSRQRKALNEYIQEHPEWEEKIDGTRAGIVPQLGKAVFGSRWREKVKAVRSFVSDRRKRRRTRTRRRHRRA